VEVSVAVGGSRFDRVVRGVGVRVERLAVGVSRIGVAWEVGIPID
jgi:hypothetical protein